MTTDEIIKGLESVKTECGKRLGKEFSWICKPIDEAIEALKQGDALKKIRAELLVLDDTLKVIDKYKAESEGQQCR